MTIYLGELADKVMMERISGKSFVEIGEICGIPNPTFIQMVYTWKTIQEPITWRQQHLDLELSRTDALQDAFWKDALTGNYKAAQIVLKAKESRMSIIEKMAIFHPGELEDASNLIIENMADALEMEILLKEQIDKFNEIFDDLDF